MKDFFNHVMQHEVTPNQVYVLYCIKNNLKANLTNVQGEIYILINRKWLSESSKLTPKALEFLNKTEGLFQKKGKQISTSALSVDALDKVNQFREIFPSGTPAGHKHYHRTNPKELLERFEWFFKTYPEYDWDMVMAATTFYVQDCSLNNYQYLQVSKYFIWKKNVTSGMIESNLATYCANLIAQPMQQAA